MQPNTRQNAQQNIQQNVQQNMEQDRQQNRQQDMRQSLQQNAQQNLRQDHSGRDARVSLEALTAAFPFFGSLPADEWTSAQPRLKSFPAGSSLFRGEDSSKFAVFLLEGTVSISTVTDGGREAVTARLSPGDICSLMVLSGLSDREYPGAMIADSEATALFVAKSSFLRWIGQYDAIRTAVFGNLLDGFIRVGSLLAGKLSLPIESRLAETLLRHTSEREPAARITHRQLAAELATAREVVSRALGRMQRQGWVSTRRGWVRVLRRDALESLVGDSVTDEAGLPW
ncbi:hypothetical protein J19TS2_50160 [Cohnella xylanilytica]|uniref:Crp/Fnr family transcriptional regulator n=1 Tax=Cohnella xylanilytica TaxID=557555 RepID=UPI001B0EBE05|nr:Crp/Fnr family transcriptional regulator [Cohnella xylanilytica]GIO15461.1 hypothetical protein J19TS2_50160 [Cohnella xylanilytica]